MKFVRINMPKVFQKGFTLIELLVVIGILGILAAALIATIDPFEQLRKANDTTSRTTGTEFLGAVTRYYGTKGVYPWDLAANGGISGCTLTAATVLNDMSTCITGLVAAGELKSSFANATQALKTVRIIPPDATTGAGPKACYLATSKSAKSDPNTKYTSAGVVGTQTCAQAAANCYYCLE